MIADLKSYPTYKDSGVPWLGKVPAHWAVTRLNSLLKERGEVNYNAEVADVLSVMKERGVIPYAEKGNVGNKKSEDITRYKVVRPNDIVMNCMNVIIGSVGLSKYTGCLSPVYYVLMCRSTNDNPHYLNAYFQTKPFQQSLVRIGNGILAHRMRIPMELLKCELFPRPPLPEQTAIVHYLDYMDRRIRKYISSKQKLIKLLEEQKQAIIHKAVTGQVDVRTGKPYLAYKPSGVEWLGDVPEHWEVKRAKYLFREVDNRSTTGQEVLLSLRMHLGLVPHKDVSTIPITAQDLVGFKKVECGQIVMNRMRAAIGMFGIAHNQGLVSPDYATLEPTGAVDPLYFLRLFKTPNARTVFRIESKGLGTGSSGFMRLYTDRFGMIKMPLPSKEEQSQIVDCLAISVKEIEVIEERVKYEISLLQEYRTRLNADIVTGKLDVCEISKQLPEKDNLEYTDEIMDDITNDENDITMEEGQ